MKQSHPLTLPAPSNIGELVEGLATTGYFPLIIPVKVNDFNSRQPPLIQAIIQSIKEYFISFISGKKLLLFDFVAVDAMEL
jgi:hypothetical protein